MQADRSLTPAALQPVRPPLIDTFGRRHTYLRVSITERCNLRCLYCMPAAGIPLKPREELLTFEEIIRLVRVFARLGIDKVRLTGGEPLVRRGVEGLVRELAAIAGIGTVAMSTNGVLLAEKAAELRAAGLSRLNISLDTLRPERFERIALRRNFEQVMGGIEAALAAGFAPLKLNCVVMRGINDDELTDFVEFARTRPIQMRLIEFMPFHGNAWSGDKLVSYDEMRAALERDYRLEPAAGEDGASNVAREFTVTDRRGRRLAGSVGFITSMTRDFCGACSRLRLTADGSIKSCLLHPAEASLRDALRAGAGDEELERRIRRAVSLKPYGHEPMGAIDAERNRSMTAIGG